MTQCVVTKPHTDTRPGSFRAGRPAVFVALLAAFLATAGGTLGCTPTGNADSPAGEDTLPEFTPSEAALFDDTLALALLGSALEAHARPAEDPKLRERSIRAEAIVPVHVSTVTSDQRGELQVYDLSLASSGPSILGSLPEDPITITITGQSPSYPFVKAKDTGLIGLAGILFLRAYTVDGARVVHWRLEAESNEVRQAIDQARASQRDQEPPAEQDDAI